jgi:GT2 family glycosyltransferase
MCMRWPLRAMRESRSCGPHPRPMSPTLSVCICTEDRPRLLQRCLESIASGEELPDHIVISDDSRDPDSTRTVCRGFENVQYVGGPRRGLGANRNNAIAASSSDYVAFIDDDAVMGVDFVREARRVIAEADPAVIFTGDLLKGDVRLRAPGAPTFLGHYHATPRGPLETVHMNSNLFPRLAFQHVTFDESIVYGYDDVDVCAGLLAHGYRIEHRPKLVNRHQPDKTPTEARRITREKARARFYVTLKRHLIWRRSVLRAALYALVASAHETGHRLMHRGTGPPLRVPHDMAWAVRRALAARADRGRC